MATIKSCEKIANDELVGDVATLGVQAEGARIVLVGSRDNENTPSHRLIGGRAARTQRRLG